MEFLIIFLINYDLPTVSRGVKSFNHLLTLCTKNSEKFLWIIHAY